MKKKILLLVAVLVVVALSNSAALAWNQMGPPVAGLLKGQSSIGVDYSYSRMSIEIGEGRTGAGAKVPSDAFDPVKMDTVTARLGYGVENYLEAFFRLGSAQARWDDTGNRFSGGSGLAIGGGAKLTFYEDESIKWGGLFQVNWAESDGSNTGPGWAGDTDLEIMQMQVAIGPSYGLTDGLSIYGGPFWQYIDGDKTYTQPNGYREKYDVDETSYIGGYIGVQVDLDTNATLSIEYQLTEDDEVLAMNIIWMLP